MAKTARTLNELRMALNEGHLSARALARLAADDRRPGVQRLIARAQRHRDAARRETKRQAQMLRFEDELWRRGVRFVAGVDEVGVGPLAGPVVAAAVVLPVGCSIEAVDDSKKLSATARTRLAPRIRERAVAYAVASCSVEEIDELNIYHASCLAMRRAVEALGIAPEHLLVDARHVPGVATPQTALIGGDGRSLSIAAASILAKVERDQIMTTLAAAHQGYGFERHKGYGTALHLAALRQLGPCAHHRRSYAPVAALCAPRTDSNLR